MGPLNCNRLWNGYASALAYAELNPTIMLCIAARIINLKRQVGSTNFIVSRAYIAVARERFFNSFSGGMSSKPMHLVLIMQNAATKLP